MMLRASYSGSREGAIGGEIASSLALLAMTALSLRAKRSNLAPIDSTCRGTALNATRRAPPRHPSHDADMGLDRRHRTALKCVMAGLYDRVGATYRKFRRADPRIAAALCDALGDAHTVVNLGAGAGSYEPRDRQVVALEPSAAMIRERSPGAAHVVRASAMDLPFSDGAFDAAMAILTIHHWPDRDRGLNEAQRVVRRRVVILTWEPPARAFWLTADYLPSFLEADRALFPPWFREHPDVTDIRPVPIPHDFTDGFLCAYWRRPEAYLDPGAQAAISTFARVGGFETGLRRLARDLADGTWYRRYSDLLREESLDLGYRIVTLEPRFR
jgi:SAM-dependent methyltransferase